MANETKLVEELADLSERQWVKVLEAAFRRRQDQPEEPPPPGLDKDGFAAWVARYYVALSPGLVRVLSFPKGATRKEIRLLTVDVIMPTLDGPIEAMPFPEAYEGYDYSVQIADISPDQWADIQKKRLALPKGWRLEGYKELACQD